MLGLIALTWGLMALAFVHQQQQINKHRRQIGAINVLLRHDEDTQYIETEEL
jgi:hypothetical protein